MEYFLANWKMYPTVDEALERVETIQDGLRQRVASGADVPHVIVCPPFVALAPLRAVVDDQLVGLGAQTCHWEQEGSYTGEVSPRMLHGLVRYVMVGHSERRASGESDEQVARKVAAVACNGLVPILFAGEDDPDDDALGETERRLRQGLARIDVGEKEVIVVYEPSWAIGADAAAPAEHVRRAVEHVKDVLRGLGATAPRVIYGGTVNDDNIDELAGVEVLDGVGATRGSLDTEGFFRMVDRVAPPPAGR
ncbi:MAG TPA: triose-phosphate isomerase family protein [Acidimicrobiales bacterium]|nr:triose-phosphate isomerase family protein [Acidimicrobiales bacterium]